MMVYLNYIFSSQKWESNAFGYFHFFSLYFEVIFSSQALLFSNLIINTGLFFSSRLINVSNINIYNIISPHLANPQFLFLVLASLWGIFEML